MLKVPKRSKSAAIRKRHQMKKSLLPTWHIGRVRCVWMWMWSIEQEYVRGQNYQSDMKKGKRESDTPPTFMGSVVTWLAWWPICLWMMILWMVTMPFLWRCALILGSRHHGCAGWVNREKPSCWSSVRTKFASKIYVENNLIMTRVEFRKLSHWLWYPPSFFSLKIVLGSSVFRRNSIESMEALYSQSHLLPSHCHGNLIEA